MSGQLDHGHFCPAPALSAIVARIPREQMEAVQCRVYEALDDELDRRTVMAALFQPPRDVHINEHGKRLYGRGLR